MDGDQNYADTDWTDGGSWRTARIGFVRLHCPGFGKDDSKSWVSGRTFSDYHCKNVFLLGSDRAVARHLQRVWRRFHAWENGIHHDEQYGNYFLYNVGLFHVGKSKENPLYACGCIAGNGGRYDRKCGDRFLYVTMSVEPKKAAYAGNVSGKFDNYAE